MKANAKIYNDNIATMKAVNAGEVDGGIIYHYYWFRDQAKTKEGSGNTALHYFKNQDPGAFVSLSGGGVLKSSKKAEQAQQFIKFVTGKAGQEVLEKGTSFEYPVASGVPANPALPPLDSLQAPKVDPSTLDAAEGDRSDDEGWLAVGGSLPQFRAPRRRFRGLNRRPARPAGLGHGRDPGGRHVHSAGLRGVGGGVGRVDARLRTGGPAPGRRAVGQHRRTGRRHRAAVCGHRCRGGLAGRAHRSARAGHSGVRCSLRRLPFRHSSTATPGWV